MGTSVQSVALGADFWASKSTIKAVATFSLALLLGSCGGASRSPAPSSTTIADTTTVATTQTTIQPTTSTTVEQTTTTTEAAEEGPCLWLSIEDLEAVFPGSWGEPVPQPIPGMFDECRYPMDDQIAALRAGVTADEATAVNGGGEGHFETKVTEGAIEIDAGDRAVFYQFFFAANVFILFDDSVYYIDFSPDPDTELARELLSDPADYQARMTTLANVLIENVS